MYVYIYIPCKYYTYIYILYFIHFMHYIFFAVYRYRIFARDGHCIDPSRPNWISGWFPPLPRPFSRSFVRPSSPRGPSRNKKGVENGWNLERNGKIIRFWVITCDFLGFQMCFFSKSIWIVSFGTMMSDMCMSIFHGFEQIKLWKPESLQPPKDNDG